MRHIIRNLRNLFKCYTQSTVFNIIGLSLAFAACYIIYVQTSYEFGFGKADANSERIFRAKLSINDKWSAVSMGRISDGIEGHRDVEAVVRHEVFPRQGKLRVNTTGEWELVERYICGIDTAMNKVFDFDMIVGEFESIANPGEVIIPLSMADEFFGGADKALGMQLKGEGNDDKVATISGVYRDFSKLSILHANKVYEKFAPPSNYKNSGSHTLFVKLREGGNIAGVKDLSEEIRDEMIEEMSMSGFSLGVDYTPINEVYFERVDFSIHPVGNRTVAISLVFVGLLILLIAIINFVNFSIAHAPRRLKAMNTYRILGHSLAGLRALIVMEAVFISVVSAGLSMLIIHYVGQTDVVNLIATSIDLSENFEAIMVVMGGAVVVGAVAGTFPAYYITNFKPAVVLNGGKSLPHSAQLVRNVLVAMQYVISISMIIIATFISLQNDLFLNYNEGYNSDNLVMVQVPRNTKAVKEHLLNNYPFIEDAVYSGSLIATDQQSFGAYKINNEESRPMSSLMFRMPTTFIEFIGIEVIDGDLPVTQGSDWSRTVAVNQSAAEMYNLKIDDKINNDPIKAIISNATLASLRSSIAPMVFYIIPESQATILYVRYSGDNLVATRDAIEATMKELVPGIDPTRSLCFNEFRASVYKAEQNLNTIISWSALLSIIIALIGVVGLVSLEAQQRTREIAIRKACGATTVEILKMLNIKFIKIVTVCFAVAVPIAYFVVNSWLGTMAYKVAMNPLVFIGAGLLIMLITIVVVTLVSYRAANTNPAEAMK